MKLIKMGDPGSDILTKKAAPVDKVTPDIVKLMDDMAKFTEDLDALGLAAPQVGYSLRIIVVRDNWTESSFTKIYKIANPAIVYREGEFISLEGCLSLPGVVREVRRAEKIIVVGLGRNGNPITVHVDNKWVASVFQHEIDHLDGVLITDIGKEVKNLQEVP